MTKTKSNSIWIVILLIISILIGCAAGLLLMPSSGSEYQKQYLEASMFGSWEFENRGDNKYYALANNSYFLIEDLGGIPVDHVALDLEVDQEDVTTKTLYFYGVKDGVEGEFVVPLERDGNGFKARLRADSVEYIRFYPTQRVRTTVGFSGMTLNDVVDGVGFPFAKAFTVTLWVFAAGCVLLKLLKKTELSWLFVTGAIIAALSAAAGIFAAGMFTAAQSTGDILAFVMAVMGAVVYGGVLLYITKVKTFAKKAFLGILIVSVAFCFATAPLQLPDETSHFLRTYSMSQGTFRYDFNDEYPNDLKLLYDYFPGEYYNHIQSDGRGNVIGSISGYTDAVRSGAVSERELHTSLQITLPYILPALEVALFRLMGCNALVCLWAARVANAVMYSLAARYAFRRASRYQVPLLIALAAPITLSMAGSVSYDAMFLAAFAVYAGTILSDSETARDNITIICAYAVMIIIKPIYIPLAALIFIRNKKPSGMKRGWLMLIMVAAGLSCWGISQGLAALLRVGISDPVYPEGVDYYGQVMFILKNPVKYLVIAIVDGYENTFYLDKWGLFGTLDVHGYLTTVLAAPAAAVCTVISGEKKKNPGQSCLLGIMTAGMYMLIVTAFYVIWSTLGSTSILGVQARYFIPVLFILSAFVCSVIKPLGTKERSMNISVYILMMLAVLGAGEVILQYYFM